MSIFVIKIIACITMFLDHVKYAIPNTRCFATEYLGRISFPLFAFLVGEGYYHTSNLKKYYARLVVFALISQIPFMLFRTLVGEWKMLNIMFTLILGLICINVFDKFEKKYYFSIPIIIAVIFVGELLHVDYGWYGVLTVFALYLCRKNKFLRVFCFVFVCSLYYIKKLFYMYSVQNLMPYIFSILSVFLLLFYNGKLGRKIKYLYYIFYPAHMLILYIISMIFL